VHQVGFFNRITFLAQVYSRIYNGGSVNQGTVVRICQYSFPVGGVSVSSVYLIV
jgi:hypothetical protein